MMPPAALMPAPELRMSQDVMLAHSQQRLDIAFEARARCELNGRQNLEMPRGICGNDGDW
jgi:hypothetical protein